MASFVHLYCACPHQDLHSFPTRRSSDLMPPDSSKNRSRTSVCCVGRTPTHAARSASCRRSRRSFSRDRKSTRLNSSHSQISYAVFCLKKKKLYEVLVVWWAKADDVNVGP